MFYYFTIRMKYVLESAENLSMMMFQKVAETTLRTTYLELSWRDSQTLPPVLTPSVTNWLTCTTTGPAPLVWDMFEDEVARKRAYLWSINRKFYHPSFRYIIKQEDYWKSLYQKEFMFSKPKIESDIQIYENNRIFHFEKPYNETCI